MHPPPVVCLLACTLLLASPLAARTQESMNGPVPASFHKDLPTLRSQADALRPLVEHETTIAWLNAVHHLPEVPVRRIWWKPGAALKPKQHAKLAEANAATWKALDWGTAAYYAPLFDTPMTYARPLDLALSFRDEALTGRRVLDFGYGGIAPLRLLAMTGIHAVGVDVEPILSALYREAGDQGAVTGPNGEDGSVRLVHGRWPVDSHALRDVGDGYDLVLSKNVLKRGFVHPQDPASPTYTDLGVDDPTFLRRLARIVNTGGDVVLYNVGFASTPGVPELVQNDLASPFAKDAWERAGFELLAFDADDSPAVQEHAQHYGWFKDADAARSLRAQYTVARDTGRLPDLPRVLILGDSISMAYTPVVRSLLVDEAVVLRATRDGFRPVNCEGTTKGVQDVDRWLTQHPGTFDVIHFNFGLHDIKRVDPITRKNSNDPSDPRQAELETYVAQLTAIVERLKQTDATLFFATTTPVPEGGVRPHRDVGDPERFNAAAREVMEAHDIAVNDLFGTVSPRLTALQRPVDVHFHAEGTRVLADQVATTVREALKKRSSRD